MLSMAKNMIAIIQQFYPEFPLFDVMFDRAKMAAIKVASGMELGVFDIQAFLKDPHSFENKVLAFNLFCDICLKAFVLHQVWLMNVIAANREALRLFYENNLSSESKYHLPQQELQSDANFSEILLQENEANKVQLEMYHEQLQSLSHKHSGLVKQLTEVKLVQIKEFNEKLKDYSGFTDQERQQYNMTPERQEKLLLRFLKIEENFLRLNVRAGDPEFKLFGRDKLMRELEFLQYLSRSNQENNPDSGISYESNIKPSSAKKITEAGLFESFLKHTPVIQNLVQEIQQVEESITKIMNAALDLMKKTFRHSESIAVINDPDYLKIDLSKNSTQQDKHMFLKLNRIYALDPNDKRFELRLSHKLKQMNEKDRLALYRWVTNALGGKDFSYQNGERLISLANVFDDHYPKYKYDNRLQTNQTQGN